MRKYGGLLVSEWVTLVVVAQVIFATGFGIYVDKQRNDMVERAQASVAAVKARIEAVFVEQGELLACDDSLVTGDVLANDFLPLSIVPIPINGSDSLAGYGIGIHVDSDPKRDGNDAFVTAKRLYEAVKEKGDAAIRGYQKENEFNDEDEFIRYSILLSDGPVCASPAPVTKESSQSGKA